MKPTAKQAMPPSSQTRSLTAESLLASDVAVTEMVTGEYSHVHSAGYHELLENPHLELDGLFNGLQNLQENMSRLEDRVGRLGFMMREIAVHIRR